MARGTLRIYLGAAPGVGKTFAMLNEGTRRARRGTNLVVGFVESHGRPNTEAVWGPDYHDETNYLRVYLAQVRRKLEPEPARPRYCLTEPGMGYRFEV